MDAGDGMGSVDISFMSFSEDEFLRISDALGCISMTSLGTYPKGTYPVSEAIDLFGAFCERAARQRSAGESRVRAVLRHRYA